MARYQCRACDFDGEGAWHSELVCPRCGSRAAVRVALAVEEMTERDLAAIKATALSGEDLAEDG